MSHVSLQESPFKTVSTNGEFLELRCSEFEGMFEGNAMTMPWKIKY
jgi:hypothetical protein